MSDKTPNMQDSFLNSARKQHTPVTVFLVNGVKLQGVITSFDNFSVILRRGSHMQLVYKHAIATVVPTVPFRLNNETEAQHGESAREHVSDYQMEEEAELV